MIMTFEEYNKYLTDIDIRIAEAGRRITYREIQLIGRQKGCSSTLMMSNTADTTEDERFILENDKTLLALRKEYDRLVAEKYYVIKYAEMPMTASEAIDKCDSITENRKRVRMLIQDKEKED